MLYVVSGLAGVLDYGYCYSFGTCTVTVYV